MPRLRSRNEQPPFGWVYHQAETGFDTNPWMGFSGAVDEIINNRKGNPRFNLPTDRASVESELEDFTVRRIMDMPGASGFLMDAPPISPPSFPMPRQQRPENAVGGAKRAVAGAALLIDWLGDGLNPVTPPHAAQRALVCAACPLNRDPNIAQSAMGAVARGFHLLMEAKAQMNLSTPSDAKLKTCQACDCDLKLKVHAEMAHIKKYTSEATMKRLDKSCWILAEA